jgi:integrase
MDRTPVNRRRDAEYIAQKALDAGLINFGKKDPLFIDYIVNFWDFENSDYIRRRNQKSPNSIGEDYAKSMGSVFRNHAIPHLPEKLKLSGVKVEHVEDVMNFLLDDGILSNASIKRVLQSMAVPLKEAKRLNMIPHNPMDSIESVSVASKPRGILTDSELQRLTLWMMNSIQEDNYSRHVYLAVTLSALTGMRQGEVRALQLSNIHIVNEEQGIITVQQSIAVYAGLKVTKGKRDRHVPCPTWLCEELISLGSENPYGTELVFWSATTANNPISASLIRKNLYRAMDAIGITKEIRTERNINFHSLRHYYVTFMRGKVTDKLLQKIVGHQSAETTDIYTHETEERLLEVGKVSANILPFKMKQAL